MTTEETKTIFNLLRKKECCLSMLQISSYKSKKDWEENCTYDYYLYLIEEELDYCVKESQILSKKEFELIKKMLGEE